MDGVTLVVDCVTEGVTLGTEVLSDDGFDVGARTKQNWSSICNEQYMKS